MNKPIRLFNTLSQTVETFTPEDNQAKIYVCGVTPYATTHLGHIFTYAMADVLIRYLQCRGVKTKYVQNLTDIDDPILREAKKQNEDWISLGKRWTIKFIEDMKKLNIQAPDYFPRATEAIEDIIDEIEQLLEAGVAYEANGSVYFDINAWPEYGKLSRLSKDEMLPIANDRGNNPDDPNKKDPLDFELWHAKQPEEPAWESPWGSGRPGWHVECSTMAKKYLGGSVDIHGGGSDLIFPHHESEIAQSENATGQHPFARIWFHTAMVRHNGKKISKSKGNLVMIEQTLEYASPDGLRLYMASHHYRSPWEYKEDDLKKHEELTQKINAAATASGGPRTADSLEIGQFIEQFHTAMTSDLDTPKAIYTLSELADAILNADPERRNLYNAQTVLREFSNLLGLKLDDPKPEKAVAEKWDQHLKKFL